MRRAVAYVTTPFQLLCVHELLRQKKLVEHCQIYCLPVSTAPSRDQVLSAQKFLGIGVKHPFRKVRNALLRNLLSYLIVIWRTIGVDALIVGHWSSSINKAALKMCKGQRYIVDDGLSSIYYPQRFENRLERLRRERNALTFKDSIKKFRDGFSIFGPDYTKLNLYSLFNSVTSNKYPSIPNRFQYLRKIYISQKGEECVVVIGQSFVEGKVCSRQIYNAYLEKVVAALRRRYEHYKIVYFPHRRETHLKELPNIFDQICPTNLVIELGLFEQNLIPVCVVSTSSTAIFSLSCIYNCDGLIMWSSDGSLFGDSAANFEERKNLLRQLFSEFPKVKFEVL